MLTSFAALDLHISITPETLFTIGGFPITNSILTGIVGWSIGIALLFYVARQVRRGKYNRMVGLVQWVFEGLLSQIDSVIPDKKLARQVAPLALSIFFFMLFAYWMSVLPGLESITYNHVPILRSLAADLNFTFAVAIIVLIMVQYHALRAHGLRGNLGRYFRNPFKDPIGAFEGILEFIGEFSRYAALSVRMFGNCFAGEILLVVISVLTSYFSIVALPIFMAFELFIGFVQAYVFFVLTLIFTSLAVETHGSHDKAKPNITSVDHSSDPLRKHGAAQTE